jgi:FkbM family methyltransferase
MESFRALQDRYRSGDLPKDQFIAAMHGLHERLFEYADLLRQSDIAKLEIDESGVISASRRGPRFRLDPNDRRQPPLEALNFGSFEGDAEAMLARLVSPGDTLFDVGANIGWHALHLALANPTGRVFAFEPIPDTFVRLQENIALNQATNVTALPFGLGERDESLRFFVDRSMPVGASAARHGNSADLLEVTAQVRRLDEVAVEYAVAPALLKIDVEGAELSVLRGALDYLRTHRPVIACELLRKWAKSFGYHPNDVIDFLASLGYDALVATGDRLTRFGRVDDQTVATNYFFLHREHHADLGRRLVNSES